MKRLIPLLALLTALWAFAPAAIGDDTESEPYDNGATERVLSTTQQWKAAMIADYYASLIPADKEPQSATGEVVPDESESLLDDAFLDDILSLRSVTGWGALLKLVMYAAATEQDLTDIQKELAEGGYGFGNLFKGLEDEHPDVEITNLGQLQKSYRHQEGELAPVPNDPSSTTPPRQDKKPHTTPPGQDKKPHKVPPGQAKKHAG